MSLNWLFPVITLLFHKHPLLLPSSEDNKSEDFPVAEDLLTVTKPNTLYNYIIKLFSYEFLIISSYSLLCISIHPSWNFQHLVTLLASYFRVYMYGFVCFGVCLCFLVLDLVLSVVSYLSCLHVCCWLLIGSLHKLWCKPVSRNRLYLYKRIVYS